MRIRRTAVKVLDIVLVLAVIALAAACVYCYVTAHPKPERPFWWPC